MTEGPAAQALLGRIAQALPHYLAELETLVNIDCGTYQPAGVNRVADHMERRFESLGWTVERRPHVPREGEPQFGDLLIARMNGELPPAQGGRRILLVGHLDTVFGPGTVADRPFRLEGERAQGPGVSDMKAGLLAGVYAVEALRDSGFRGFESITYVCNPDEEIGSPFSRPVITECARSADVCFVLEGARENGDIVSARKGVNDLLVEVTGRAAHAGVEPERGRSAALAAAHAIVALHALNGRWPGVTVNVGVVRGGTRPNVVTERCEMEVDVRAPTAALMDEAMGAVEGVLGGSAVPDTTIAFRIVSGFPPMEKSEATARLVERAVAIAGELGFELKDAATGGASDANPVAGMGVPTLDGLGPVGGADHAPGEWLDVSTVAPRTALLAAMIASRA